MINFSDKEAEQKNLRMNETLNQAAASCAAEGMFPSSALNDFALGGPSTLRFSEDNNLNKASPSIP
jgi:hypothetical protein